MLALLVLGACLFVWFLYLLHDRRPPLYFAIVRGDTNALSQYLAGGRSVRDQVLAHPLGGPGRDRSLLQVAAQAECVESVEFLLKHGADPNDSGPDGEVPLNAAIGGGGTPARKAATIRLLLAAGADPNRHDQKGFQYSPLLSAALFGETNVIITLLKAGADVNETNGVGQTSLHLAWDAATAKVLLDAGANRDALDRTGATPLSTAVGRGRQEVVYLLTAEARK